MKYVCRCSSREDIGFGFETKPEGAGRNRRPGPPPAESFFRKCKREEKAIQKLPRPASKV